LTVVLLIGSLGMGGAERQVIELGERLRSRGHRVAVLSLAGAKPQEWQTSLDVVRLGMTRSPIAALATLARAYRFLDGFRPDVVHSHTKHANLAARFLRLTGAARRVVSTLHSVRDGGQGRLLLYRWTDALVAHTTAVSEAVAERYVQARAVPREKCSVVTNAIDTGLFCPDATRRAETRTQFGAGKTFVWLAAGRVTEAKDYPNLLEAFRRVREAEVNVELWVAGEGGERMAAQPSVRWLGLQRDMAALFDAADGFVLSSAWEGLPLAVGEAMAMEKPVVATRAGGVAELVGECGVLVETRNAEALAAAMSGVMRADDKTRGELGQSARKRVEKLFSWDAKVVEWERLYERVIEHR